MTEIANSTDKSANSDLTESQDASICAALPRSSNGKTTDSDSVDQAPIRPIVHNPDPVCSPRETARLTGECEPSTPEILADLARVRAVFQLRTIELILRGGL